MFLDDAHKKASLDPTAICSAMRANASKLKYNTQTIYITITLDYICLKTGEIQCKDI